MKTQIEITKIIEAYLNGNLIKEEFDQINALVEKDKEFADLIKLHCEVNDSIRDNDFFLLRNKLDQIFVYKPINYFKRFLRIAALIVFIMVAALAVKIYFFDISNGPELYEIYYIRYEPDVITRSSFSSNIFNEALLFYELGNYNRCITILDSLIIRNQDDYLAMFYKGLTCLELKSPLYALESFSKIPINWNDPYAEHRDWYIALSLLYLQREQEALIQFRKIIKSNSLYSAKSKLIVRRLEK